MTSSYWKVRPAPAALALLALVLSPTAAAHDPAPPAALGSAEDARLRGPPLPVHGQIVVALVLAGHYECVLVVSLHTARAHPC